MAKYLVVGLGNIGEEYAGTRHNIGFEVVSRLAADNDVQFTPDRYGDVAEMKHRGNTLILLKPNTYMNLSGKAVNYWLQKEKLTPENLLVVVDDLALPFGALRLKGKGSDGGHNGLKNINQMIGTQAYARIRFGIGSEFGQGHQIDYVLGRWTSEELNSLGERVSIAAEMVKSYAAIGLQLTMTQFNNK